MISDQIQKARQAGLPSRWTFVILLGVFALASIALAVLGILAATGSHVARHLLLPLSMGVAFLALSFAIYGLRYQARLGRLATQRARDVEEAWTVLQVLAENAPVVLMVADGGQTITYANGLARRTYGRVKGRCCHDVTGGRVDGCEGCTGRTRPSATAPAAASAMPMTAESIAFTTHTVPVPGGGRGTILIGRVMTEQKRLQAQLLHRERLATLGLMAAGIAHDLGSPLAALSGNLQRLDGIALPEPAASICAGLGSEIRRLSRTTRELVDFARRRRDGAALVSVATAVGDALRILRHDPRLRSIEVVQVADPETPSVHIVEDHLAQVLLNLLINAVDAMPEGGVLRTDVGDHDGSVRITIADTGIGMSPELLSRVFEPFFTTKPPGQGAGLGLSLCREILEGFGGTLVLESRQGIGTTAVVTLPAGRPKETP